MVSVECSGRFLSGAVWIASSVSAVAVGLRGTAAGS